MTDTDAFGTSGDVAVLIGAEAGSIVISDGENDSAFFELAYGRLYVAIAEILWILIFSDVALWNLRVLTSPNKPVVKSA